MQLSATEAVVTLPFDAFWQWLVLHPNCVLRIGGTQAVLYDDDDLHWIFVVEEDRSYAQLVRGKRLVGELAIMGEEISYVQGFEGDRQGEYVFEMIREDENNRIAAAFVIMTHGLDEEDDPSDARAVH